VALGSVKSNFGHLKGAAGAAGLLKTTLALRDKVLPPSLHCEHPNPSIDFAHSPLYVNTELRPWTQPADGVRCAGVSAFGFGGTNFHLVLEEHIPHRLNGNGKRLMAVSDTTSGAMQSQALSSSPLQNRKDEGAQASAPVSSVAPCKAPLRGALVLGAASGPGLAERLRQVQKAAEAGQALAPAAPAASDLSAPERIAIDYADAADLAEKCSKALKALAAGQPAIWKALRAQGIFRGRGPAPKVAFLYTGQGSQYVNMLRTLRASEPIVAATFAEADQIMTPILGKPLSEFIYVDKTDAAAVAKAEEDLRQTAITQPAVLACDIGLTRLLAAYGIQPDLVMGHSLGEYGALVAAGALPFAEALEAVAARGREMTRVSMEDNGRMAAIFAPLEEIERIVKTIEGYVVIANINSNSQAVIGGASKAVELAVEAFQKAGFNAVPLPVSHAFHTSIVAGASEPLRQMLRRLHLQAPRLPIVANVDGEFYPTGPDVVPQMSDILARQIASPVQFVKGLQTLYDAGARVFIETGPKKALQGFAEDVLGNRNEAVSLFCNHPKFDDIAAFNQALCALYAAGLGRSAERAECEAAAQTAHEPSSAGAGGGESRNQPTGQPPLTPHLKQGGDLRDSAAHSPVNGDRFVALGKMFAEVLDRGWKIYHGENHTATNRSVTVTGAALGLPGTERIFDDGNVGRILRGEQFINVLPAQFRRAILDKHVTRLVKTDNGGPTFELIDNVANVIKLAGRGGAFDLEKEFGISADRVAALDRSTRLAIAVGIDALRDAGIPLVMRYKNTTKATQLPDRWGLPEDMRDDTGVIFASIWPGLDSFAAELSHYYADHARREQIAMLESLRARLTESNGNAILGQEMDRRMDELRAVVEAEPYAFDRRFIFRVLAMGHSQFAELIGARGPNTQINAACASTTQAVALAEDWIRAGRCRRVAIIASDDPTSDQLMGWMGAGFLATGAAATDEVVEEAALPFDRRRHGLIVGMGAAALVMESEEAARERGIRPICEVLSAVTANSAYHGTRLDIQHICQVMEHLVARAEVRSGISRQEMARQMVFVSHETYTPARGGSASAEVNALRRVFGEAAAQIVITNTKGFTGHAMGVGIEDVVAVKALETGCVPPVANFKEVDPELGALNLSKGGIYPVSYALRLGAGFGSQISMTLLRLHGPHDAARPTPRSLGYAYRIIDRNAWSDWLRRTAGRPVGELEVVHRTLRVPDQGPQVRSVGASRENQSVLAPATEQQAPPKPASRTEVAPPARIGGGNTPKVEAQGAVPAPLQPPRPASQSRDAGLVGLTPVLPSPKPEADPVRAKILALVSEKTGYPPDMLDLDLDLEADLGVDTVKQAEVFASVREAYGIARDDQLRLRDFPTLAHVIRFVYERRPDLADPRGARPVEETQKKSSGPPETPQPMENRPAPLEPETSAKSVGQGQNGDRPGGEPLPPTAVAIDPVKDGIIELVVEKTGYPREMLDLDLDLEADLGVDTVKQAEMFAAIRATYNIPREENMKLRDFPTLAHVIRFVYDRRPDLAAASGDRPSGEPAVLQSSQQLEPQTAAESDRGGPNRVQPVASPGAPTNGSDHSVTERILSIAAEKTGYPQEMLDLDLDLEADLGIDTVKQAEMFASVRSAFNIPRDENLKLRDFPTLAHVIQFAQDRQPNLAGAPVTAGEPKTSAAEAPRPSESQGVPRPVLASLDAANSIPRRVPVPNLRPPLAVCKPTGVTLGPGRRVIVKLDNTGVGEVLAQRLQTMGVEVLRLGDEPDANALTDRLKTWLSAGPVHGVYWLPALDSERSHTIMDLAAWRAALGLRVKSLYATMRVLYDQIAAPDNFLVSASRLGGQHGYDQAGATAPLGGAVVGFTKTYKRERMDALVKAVDFEPSRTASELAEILIEETLRDPGAVEIGHQHGQRWTVGLQEQPAADGQPGMVLDKDTVFLVTGAAGSIVSAITADLAAASGGIFYLLDLVPEPDPTDSDLKRFVSDKDGLKRDLFARIQQRGERATPALVEKQLAVIERAVAAQTAIDAVTAAGGTAHYFSVNLMDSGAVAKVIDQVRERCGHIDVLLHAAGIERSHLLPDKDVSEFDLVFDVKSDGWFNLLNAIGEMPLGATVAFSSIAGRFGNRGQADYSAANDLLCKIASSFRTSRTATRAIAIDWTAWGGIGMATRGSIPKMMEQAGIDMLPPEAGIPLIRRELTAGGTRGEVVIAQRLGILMNEWDPSGGLDAVAALECAQAPAGGPSLHSDEGPLHAGPIQQGLMVGRITSLSVHQGLTIETTLDPNIQPFLYDHQINGNPVLPGVMGIEAFAEAALWMLPGWHVEAVEDVNFLAPFKFYRNEPRTLETAALIYPQDDCLLAACRLTGRRPLPNQTEPQVTTHFTARVRLAKQSSASRPGHLSQVAARGGRAWHELLTTPAGPTLEASDIYSVYFHGPAYQVVERAWRDGNWIIGAMKRNLPPNHHPAERPTLMAPRLIELCFQTAGLWEMDVQGRMGLPKHVERVCFWGAPAPAEERLFAVVTPDTEQGSFDAEVVDAKGNAYVSLYGYRTVALPDSIDTERLKSLRESGSRQLVSPPGALLREDGSRVGWPAHPA